MCGGDGVEVADDCKWCLTLMALEPGPFDSLLAPDYEDVWFDEGTLVAI